MNALDVGVEVAVLDALETLAARYDDPWQTVFDGGPATARRGECSPLVVHPAAMIGTAVDDVMCAELSACPGCGADAGVPCRWDCSSHCHE